MSKPVVASLRGNGGGGDDGNGSRQPLPEVEMEQPNDGGKTDDHVGSREPLPEVEMAQPKTCQMTADEENSEPGNIGHTEGCRCCWLSANTMVSVMETIQIVEQASSSSGSLVEPSLVPHWVDQENSAWNNIPRAVLLNNPVCANRDFHTVLASGCECDIKRGPSHVAVAASSGSREKALPRVSLSRFDTLNN